MPELPLEEQIETASSLYDIEIWHEKCVVWEMQLFLLSFFSLSFNGVIILYFSIQHIFKFELIPY